jgi:uncharacterized BrkB/YihY/UPF0761 family membrane protein
MMGRVERLSLRLESAPTRWAAMGMTRETPSPSVDPCEGPGRLVGVQVPESIGCGSAKSPERGALRGWFADPIRPRLASAGGPRREHRAGGPSTGEMSMASNADGSGRASPVVTGMTNARRLLGSVDRWQRRNRFAGRAYGVVKKFGDDNANLLVVSLAWYGFTAIFPLLLVVVTIFGFIGQKALGNGIISTLHKFPIVGADFNPAGSGRLHGSGLGLVIGLVGLLYGAQGVTHTAQNAMASVWNVPQIERTGFVPRLGRSLAGLFIIGGAFLINAFVSTYATGASEGLAVRVLVIAALAVLNVGLYYASFAVLTPKVIRTRSLLPGAVAGAIVFTLLITVGTGLVTHQLKNVSNTYGTFGSVIGVVLFLLLLSKFTIYAAELNPVLERSLYSRALPLGEPTDADRQVQYALAHQERRGTDQTIGVGPDASHQAAIESGRDDENPNPEPDAGRP